MKKTLTLLLSLILITGVVLAGCQGAATTATTKPAGTTATTKHAVTTAPTSDNTLYEFTLMGNLGAEIKEPDQVFFDNLGQRLNLKINIELPPATSYAERLQMMLASTEYPELVLFLSHTDVMFVNAVKNGVFLPLNDYLENSPNLLQYSYDISFESLKILKDGVIYAIPRTSIARADGQLVRKDWLDSLGIEFQEGEAITLAKLEEIATAFTFDDPDGNGANDTYGIGTHSSADGNMDVLYPWAFDLIGWHEYDGEYMDLRYSKTHDNYKEALAFTNKLWKAGVIDPDWPTIKQTVSLERFKKGITGIVGEFAGWLTSTEATGKELNPDFELAYITAVIAKEGNTAKGGSFSTGFWGSWSITKNTEKPERIMAMLDYLLSDDYWEEVMYGPKGVTWNEENGIAMATDKYKDYALGKALLRRNNAPAFFVSLAQPAEARARIEGLIDVCIKQAVFSKDEGFRPSMADDPKFIDYVKQMNINISKIIVGDLPIDQWDTILAGWYAAGGEQYVKEMQDHIKAKNP
jgi:putative aldouronate transport system substrate-binding protein